MITFTRYEETRLYTPVTINGPGYVVFYLCDTGNGTPSEISLEDSWEDEIGYYLFLSEAPSDLEEFALALDDAYSADEPLHTSFRWITCTLDGDEYVIEEAGVVDAKTITVGLDDEIVIVDEVFIHFGGYKLPFGPDAPIVYQLNESSDIIGFIFEYPPAPENLYPPDADLPPPDPYYNVILSLEEEARGSFQRRAIIGDFFSEENTSWDVALRYVAEIGEAPVHQFYPVFDTPQGTSPCLWMCWDPLNHLDPDRTYLEFIGSSLRLAQSDADPEIFSLEVPDNADIIPTYFRSVTGDRIGVKPLLESDRPPRLVFELLTEVGAAGAPCYYLVPSGDFELLLIDDAGAPLDSSAWTTDPAKFLCGLSGIESVGFTPPYNSSPGDVITFFPKKAAFAPVFPILDQAGGAAEAALPLLTERFHTAWVSFARNGGAASGSIYYAQPEDAPLYQKQDPQGKILKLMEPIAAQLPTPSAEYCFPVAPAVGADPHDDLGEERDDFLQIFEKQILGPFRREKIRNFPPPPPGGPGMAGTGETMLGASPQGLVAEVNGAQWAKLVLAQGKGGTNTLQFRNLNPTLQAAFQTNALFLAVTRDTYLRDGSTQFDKTINIETWNFTLDVGRNRYDEFRNTLLFKFSPGSIVDLVAEPKSWTNAPAFNWNGEGQLAGVSAWLTNYIADGIARAEAEEEEGIEDGPYMRFRDIVTDPDWTGVLALKVELRAENFPPQLRALLAGMNTNQLVAHHFAFESSYVDSSAGAEIRPSESSLFGLIHYEDPTGALGGGEREGMDYEFKVLELKVVFDNSAVKEFSSTISLHVGRLFGEGPSMMEIDGEEGENLTIILKGAYETHSGSPTYTFNLDSGPVTYYLPGKVIEYVEILKAQFYTVVSGNSTPGSNDLIRGNFAFFGNIKFYELKQATPAATFDIFSFDNLRYSNLILGMSFYPNDTSRITFLLDTEQMSFDTDNSDTRGNSLYKKFPMQLQRLTYGRDSKKPSDVGFITIVPPINIGRTQTTWYGFEYTLNLGTPGNLAERVGLTATLLVSWSPTLGTLNAEVGLKIPGVSGTGGDLFSLQGVVRLASDFYQFSTFGTENVGYLLLLRNMALRILSIKIPPGGATNIWLFGNPAQANPNDTALGWYASYQKQD